MFRSDISYLVASNATPDSGLFSRATSPEFNLGSTLIVE